MATTPTPSAKNMNVRAVKIITAAPAEAERQINEAINDGFTFLKSELRTDGDITAHLIKKEEINVATANKNFKASGNTSFSKPTYPRGYTADGR